MILDNIGKMDGNKRCALCKKPFFECEMEVGMFYIINEFRQFYLSYQA